MPGLAMALNEANGKQGVGASCPRHLPTQYPPALGAQTSQRKSPIALGLTLLTTASRSPHLLCP